MVALLKKVLKQYKIWKPLVATKNILYQLITAEKKKSYGENYPDKTFYIIRSINDRSPFYIGPVHHLLANYFYVLSHLKYAEIKGWIPIIDQLHYPVYNSLQEPVHGETNPWEYFWEQPCNYSLDEIYHSKNVVLSKRSWFGQWDMGYDVKNYTDKSIITFYNRLTKNFVLKPYVVESVEHFYKELFRPGERILGVSVRYVGYSARSYFQGAGHPIAPELATLISDVKEKCEAWNMDRIFLACDDQESAETFQLAFGDQLILMPKQRTDTTKHYDAKNNINPLYLQKSIYKTSLNYLIEMELLSKCTGLIGSITSGLRYALVQNNNRYEFVEIIDCGRFPDPKKRSQC